MNEITDETIIALGNISNLLIKNTVLIVVYLIADKLNIGGEFLTIFILLVSLTTMWTLAKDLLLDLQTYRLNAKKNNDSENTSDSKQYQQ